MHVQNAQKPQASPAVLHERKKERKNEKVFINLYATIINPKCEENKWVVFKKVLSSGNFTFYWFADTIFLKYHRVGRSGRCWTN